MTGRLTVGKYWDATYTGQTAPTPLDVTSYRSLNNRRTVELIQSVVDPGSSVLEVGAGNSAVLTHLAAKNPGSSFAGLDYSAAGCDLLRRRAEIEGVKVEVVEQDLFSPPSQPGKAWDVVYSLGVVEHFEDVVDVLCAKQRLLNPRGVMVTVIPNMAGILGHLTRRWNPSVYALHVPHTRGDLEAGHLRAGLRILRSGYLCSNNFGVLSSCFPDNSGSGWTSYRWLSRISTVLWRLEHLVGDLPKTSLFSPYIFVVSTPAR